MDLATLKMRLETLANGAENRSKTARLRDVIQQVETALHAGVKRTVIRDELAAQGLEMTLQTFDSALKRIRRERTKLTSVTPVTSGIPVVQSRFPVPPKVEPVTSSRPEETAIASEPTLVTKPKILSAAERKAYVDAQVAAAFPNRFEKPPTVKS